MLNSRFLTLTGRECTVALTASSSTESLASASSSSGTVDAVEALTEDWVVRVGRAVFTEINSHNTVYFHPFT